MKYNFILILWAILAPVLATGQVLSGFEGHVQEIDIADGFTGVGARAMGMGGAQICLANDYSAVFWNPAQLAYIKRIELSGGITYNLLKNESSFYDKISDEKASHARLNSLGLVLPLPTSRGGVSFGLGFNRLQNFDRIFAFKHPTEGDRGLERKSGGLYTLCLGSGIQISPIMSVGLNMEFWGGSNNYSWDYENYLPDNDSINKIIFEDNYKYLYSGFSGRLGLTVNPHKMLSFGGVITFPAGFTIDEEGTQKTDTLFSDGGEAYYDDFGIVETYKISLPFRFSVGAALMLPYFTTSFDLGYIDWTQMEFKEPSWALSDNKYIPNDYRAIFKYSVGLEAIVPYTPIKLRGGYRYDPLPYVGNTIDEERTFFSGGIGILLSDLFTIDLAGEMGKYTTSNSERSLSEKYELTNIILTMAYRF
ncbi:hypothetical protein JW877_08330 [bacterium]|nr:hypothetical protein [bacterium]